MFRRMIYYLFLTINLTSLNSAAQDSIWLDKDKSAPFSGYLIPEDTVKKLRNDSLEKDMYKGLYDSTTKSINLYQQEVTLKDNQLKLLMDQNDKLANQISSATSFNMWEKIGLFGAGVLLTGLAIKSAHDIYH